MSYRVTESTKIKIQDILARFTGSGNDGVTGHTAQVNRRPLGGFWAIICDEETNSGTVGYPWKEAEYLGGGNWQVLRNGRRGDTAYEINDNMTFPGTVVYLMYTTQPGDYVFYNTSDPWRLVSCVEASTSGGGSGGSGGSGSGGSGGDGSGGGGSGGPECEYTNTITLRDFTGCDAEGNPQYDCVTITSSQVFQICRTSGDCS